MESTENTTVKENFFNRHYGSSQKSLTQLAHFIQQTELNTEQVYAVLAQGKFRPRLSDNVAQHVLGKPEDISLREGGGRYVNGQITSLPPLNMKKNASDVQLTNTSEPRFDRLQRMIRLQRWLDIPFADLDSLLLSTMRCAREASSELIITDNTLRVLGVYRYLSQRYALQADEFSALLHEIPVHATGDSESLFDRVFNRVQRANVSLKLDGTPLDIMDPDPAAHTTLYTTCAALNLDYTPDSFGLLIKATQKYLPSLKRDLTTFSSIYRQARIARLFGLSVAQCSELADLLGGPDYQQQLILPTLRKSGSNAPADFLDVLMQMDWMIQWLQNNGTTLQQLRRQLLLDNGPLSAPLRERMAQFEEVMSDLQDRLLPSTEFETLNLPQPEPGVPALKHAWEEILVMSILKHHPFLPQEPDESRLQNGLADFIEKYTKFSTDPDKDKSLKIHIKNQLNSFLLKAYTHLQPWKNKLEPLLKDTSQVSENSDVFKHTFKSAFRRFVKVLKETPTPREFKDLLLMLPDAVTLLELPLSQQALQQFLLNPHWLDSDYKAKSDFKLSFNTLYLFQQFKHCISTYGLTEDDLLSYLQLANQQDLPLESRSSDLLSALLGWSTAEINVLINRLPHKQVQSMAHIDWLMRCHDASKIIGLSVDILLTATELSSHIPSNEWAGVGAAVHAIHY